MSECSFLCPGCGEATETVGARMCCDCGAIVCDDCFHYQTRRCPRCDTINMGRCLVIGPHYTCVLLGMLGRLATLMEHDVTVEELQELSATAAELLAFCNKDWKDGGE